MEFKFLPYVIRLAPLVNDSSDSYNLEDISIAVLDVLDKYTFFEDAYETLSEWKGGKGALQRKIVDEYTDEIPQILRMVRYSNIRSPW